MIDRLLSSKYNNLVKATGVYKLIVTPRNYYFNKKELK
jgi:hypothetical protein